MRSVNWGPLGKISSWPMNLGHLVKIEKFFEFKKHFSLSFVKNISYDLYMLFKKPSNHFLSSSALEGLRENLIWMVNIKRIFAAHQTIFAAFLFLQWTTQIKSTPSLLPSLLPSFVLSLLFYIYCRIEVLR